MEKEHPKYLLYFNLRGNVIYDEAEFNTIGKLVKNLIDNKYFQLDYKIFFNQEITNYKILKNELSDDIMLIMGQIDDELVDSIISDIVTIIGIDDVIRRRSEYDFNDTGYSDEELVMKFADFVKEAEAIEVNLEDDYTQNSNYLQQKQYLNFCNYLIKNENLDDFSLLKELNVLEALFANFPYFLRYIMSWDLSKLVVYYNKDLIKILRNIRIYVSQSEVDQDNVKELFVYKYILETFFATNKLYYDPEEAFDKVKNKLEVLIKQYNQKRIEIFDRKFKLFKGNYQILSIADAKSKTFKEYDKIASNINKHFEKLKPLLKSFRTIENNFVKFNSKKKHPERIKTTLEQFKESGIVKDYQEKFGIYNITLESSEHIPYLQGKWFEYYTARVCSEIIEGFIAEGYKIDFEIMQNVLVQIDNQKRELDIVAYLNGHLFYIENKIDSKNTFSYDIEKYRINTENMNIDSNNCYLVFLEGEDRKDEDIKFYQLKAFRNRFTRKVKKILETDEKTFKEKKLAIQRAEKEKEAILKSINKTKTTLYLRHHIDYEVEEKRIRRTIQKYDEEIIKITFPNKDKFFEETLIQIEESGNEKLKEAFQSFQDIYETNYHNKLAFNMPDKIFFNRLGDELAKIDDNDILINAREKLYCLAGNIEKFLNLGDFKLEEKLLILCGYGDRHDNYLEVLENLLSLKYIFSLDRSCYLLVHYLNNIGDDILRDSIVINKFIAILEKYLTNVEALLINKIIKIRNSIMQIRKEREFIGVLINTFMVKHFQEFSLYGLVFSNIDTFIYRVSTNQMIYRKSIINSELGKHLLSYNPIKTAYFENKYEEASKILFENSHELKNEIQKMINADERMIFEVKKNNFTAKALKVLKECGVIADYQTVKNVDLYIGIFTNFQVFNWFKQYSWIGNYLSNRYDSDPLYTNVDLHYQEDKSKLLLLKKVGRSVTYCLFKFINTELKFACGIVSANSLKQALDALRDDDYNLNIKDITYQCDKRILKKVQ